MPTLVRLALVLLLAWTVQLVDVVNNGDGTRTVTFRVRDDAGVIAGGVQSVTVPTTMGAEAIRATVRHRAWQTKYPAPAAVAPAPGQTFTLD